MSATKPPHPLLDPSVEGSGLLLTGDPERREWSGVQVLAEVTGNRLRLLNRDGREQVIQP
jgi:hypothetical protein